MMPSEIAEVVEVQAMSEVAEKSATCPACLYDLRAATKEPDGRVRCAECGGVWDDAALQRGHNLLYEPESRFGCLLMFGPGFVLPTIGIVVYLFISNLEVILSVPLFLLAVYALIHSHCTTPVRPFRSLHVAIRAIMLFIINLIVAAVVLWACLFLVLLYE